MPSPAWPIQYCKSHGGVAVKFRCWKFQVTEFGVAKEL